MKTIEAIKPGSKPKKKKTKEGGLRQIKKEDYPPLKEHDHKKKDGESNFKKKETV